MWRIDDELLEKVYKDGRFKSAATIFYETTSLDDYSGQPQIHLYSIESPEAVEKRVKTWPRDAFFRKQSPEPRLFPVGTCRMRDIHHIFEVAAREGDSPSRNPNLIVFRSAELNLKLFAEKARGVVKMEDRHERRKQISLVVSNP